jgi:hypothetical protein
MFSGASDFDQDLGDWDVSSGTDFVSTERSFGFRFNMHYACDLIEYTNE